MFSDFAATNDDKVQTLRKAKYGGREVDRSDEPDDGGEVSALQFNFAPVPSTGGTNLIS